MAVGPWFLPIWSLWVGWFGLLLVQWVPRKEVLRDRVRRTYGVRRAHLRSPVLSLCHILSVKSEFLRWVHIEGEGELNSLLMGGVVLEESVGPYKLLWPFLENAISRIRGGRLGWGCTGDGGGDYWCFMLGAETRAWKKRGSMHCGSSVEMFRAQGTAKAKLWERPRVFL